MRAGLPCPVHKWIDPVPGIIPGRISDAFGSQTRDSNEWWGPSARQEGGTFTSISPRSITSIQCWNHTAGRTKHIRKLKALSATNSDLACTPSSTVPSVGFGFRFVLFSVIMSHHWQIYSTKDPTGFVFQFAFKTQLPSFRKCKWNFKSNFNKIAKELEQKDIKNSRLSKKINDGRGQSVLAGLFLHDLASDPHQVQAISREKFLSRVSGHTLTDTCHQKQKTTSTGIKHFAIGNPQSVWSPWRSLKQTYIHQQLRNSVR